MVDKIEFSITLPDAAGWKLRRYIPIPPDFGHYFPPVDRPFVLHTRAGDITTKLSGQAPHFSLLVGLGILFDKCPFLQPKEQVHFEQVSSEEFILDIPKWNQNLDVSPSEKEDASINREITATPKQQVPSPILDDSSKPLQGKSHRANEIPSQKKQQTQNQARSKPAKGYEQERFSVSLPRKFFEWKEGQYIELPKNHSKRFSSLADQNIPLILHTPWGKMQQDSSPESNKFSKNYRVVGMDLLFKHNPDLQSGDALIFTHREEGNFGLEVKKIGPRKTPPKSRKVREENSKKSRQRKVANLSNISLKNLLNETTSPISKQNTGGAESRRSWLEHIRFMISNILVIPDMKEFFTLPFPSDSFVTNIFSQLRRIQQQLLVEINSRTEQAQASNEISPSRLTGEIEVSHPRENIIDEKKDQGIITPNIPQMVTGFVEHPKDLDNAMGIQSRVNLGQSLTSIQQLPLPTQNKMVGRPEMGQDMEEPKKGFNQRYREFWSQLKDYHISLIKDILEEKKGFDQKIRKLAQEQKCMPEEIIDDINYLAYNSFGDTLIDTTNEKKKIIPEYLPRVIEAIKCEINEAEFGEKKEK